MSDGVIGGWGYFIDFNWGFAHSIEMGFVGEMGGHLKIKDIDALCLLLRDFHIFN